MATHHEIDLAVARARTSLAAWRDLGASTHAAILRRAGDAMSASRARSIAVMGRDGGKTVSEADPEVSEGVDFARFYADQATALADLGESAALGVVLVVPPWNFPYAITAGGILAAVAAGNTVIVKPAPETTAVAYELVSQLWDAGVPRDVLQMVPTRDDECGRHLVTHEGIDAVVLTGSYDTAAMFTAWKPALRLLGETSGKNAIVVTASADVDLAVRDLVHSAFSHAGQKCSAASLAILTGSVYENSTFLDQLVDAVTSLRVGPSYDPATHVGPLIHPPESALERALQQLDDGESWLVEPRPLDDAGFVWRPGVKIGVRPGSWSHLNEWFGPVLAIMVARNLDEALDWQNATPYALTGGLHSLDTGECEHWIERVEVGNLYVNRTTTGAVVARQPFGGWRRSRVGPTAKAGGENYVNCLRDWPRVVDTPSAIASAAAWWREKGSMARDNAELSGERNLVRYRRASKPVALRVDAQVTSAEIEYLRSLCELAGVTIDYSSATLLRGLFDVTLESVDEFVARSDSFSWVRWISDEEAPTDVLVARGVRVDTRTLAQCGAVELPRWLLEQSVAITNHRYGNLHAGPKPNCPGLGVSPRHPAN